SRRDQGAFGRAAAPEPPRRSRLRGARPGDLHEDRGFHRGLPRLREQEGAALPGEMRMAFLEPEHEELARRVRAFADEALAPLEHRETEVDELALQLLSRLGEAGLTAFAVPAAYGGAKEK